MTICQRLDSTEQYIGGGGLVRNKGGGGGGLYLTASNSSPVAGLPVHTDEDTNITGTWT